MLTVCGIVASVALLVGLTVKVKLHPFFALTLSSVFFGLFVGFDLNTVLDAYSSGLGGTIAGIGVVIAIGTVMGTLMEASGSAEKMAATILRITGKRHAALGLGVTGYFVSIPVFSDSAFVLLSPLAKRLSRDTATSMTTMAVALAMGLHATHMLVPPTPGPLAVSGIVGADLGLVILLGMLVSIPVAAVALVAGRFLGARNYYQPEDVAESLPADAKLPRAVEAFLPILVPIFLMLLRTVALLPSHPFGEGALFGWIHSLGNTVAALLIGLAIAAFTYFRLHPHDRRMWAFDGGFGEALRTAGQIVLIVGAGGAFAAVLKLSDLQGMVERGFSGVSVGILVPFAIGAIFRTAIGSGTVGMITAASMLVPLLGALGLATPVGRVIAMLACASGGFMVFHGNDDFFWVVTSSSGMKPETAYRVLPLVSVLQAFTSLGVVYVLYLTLV